MQETIPKVEKELDEWTADYVAKAVSQLAAIFDEIPTYRYFEGNKSISLRESGEVDVTNMEEASADSEIPIETILYGETEDILRALGPVADQLAKQKSEMLIRFMDEVTKKTGNIVSSKGKPLTPEMFLSVLEKMDIDFDANGNAIMPSAVVGSELFQKISEWSEQPEEPSLTRRREQILEKKKAEWRAREANRILVG